MGWTLGVVAPVEDGKFAGAPLRRGGAAPPVGRDKPQVPLSRPDAPAVLLHRVRRSACPTSPGGGAPPPPRRGGRAEIAGRPPPRANTTRKPPPTGRGPPLPPPPPRAP